MKDILKLVFKKKKKEFFFLMKIITIAVSIYSFLKIKYWYKKKFNEVLFIKL